MMCESATNEFGVCKDDLLSFEPSDTMNASQASFGHSYLIESSNPGLLNASSEPKNLEIDSNRIENFTCVSSINKSQATFSFQSDSQTSLSSVNNFLGENTKEMPGLLFPHSSQETKSCSVSPLSPQLFKSAQTTQNLLGSDLIDCKGSKVMTNKEYVESRDNVPSYFPYRNCNSSQNSQFTDLHEVEGNKSIKMPSSTAQGESHIPQLNRQSSIENKDNSKPVITNEESNKEQKIIEYCSKPFLHSSSNPYKLVSQLGYVKPFWISDNFCDTCLYCCAKFSVVKGDIIAERVIFCSSCCSKKVHLPSMNFKVCRVCKTCFHLLQLDLNFNKSSDTPPHHSKFTSNSSNNEDRCSNKTRVNSILSNKSNKKSSNRKKVMFSDGSFPGSENCRFSPSVDISSSSNSSFQKMDVKNSQDSLDCDKCHIPAFQHKVINFVRNSSGLEYKTTLEPNFSYFPKIYTKENKEINFSSTQNFFERLKVEELFLSISYNLKLGVRILHSPNEADLTMFVLFTDGLACVGQAEIFTVLRYDTTNAEKVVKIMLNYCNFIFDSIYVECVKGSSFKHLDICLIKQPSPHSDDLFGPTYPGFLFFQPTKFHSLMDCLGNVQWSAGSILFSMLIHKWEVVWAKLLPLRLLLRLGMEYSVYPYPLFSQLGRRAVFFEVGQTIISLLADFRNFSYAIPFIPALKVSVSYCKNVISIPCREYKKVLSAVNTVPSEHVFALTSDFSSFVNSYYVCVQSDDTFYHSKLFPKSSKSNDDALHSSGGVVFVVFNASLKDDGNKVEVDVLEDGLLIHTTIPDFELLKTSLKEMLNFHLNTDSCVESSSKISQSISIEWVEDFDHTYYKLNPGVFSPIDGLCLENFQRVCTANFIDYTRLKVAAIRWVETFFIESQTECLYSNPFDPSKLIEKTAHSFCTHLLDFLSILIEEHIKVVHLRISSSDQKVGYEVSSLGEASACSCLSALDDLLIPIINAKHVSFAQPSFQIELVFHILNYYDA